MAPAVKLVAPRKRNRKRKRRAVSESSSESSSSESSSDSDRANPRLTTTPRPTKTAVEDLTSSSSSSDSSSDSDSESERPLPAVSPVIPKDTVKSKSTFARRLSPSPPPPPTKIPSFIPPAAGAEQGASSQEQMMKDRFRKFWMESIADGFKDDLEEIRKEPNLGAGRLALLIDSLASGADIFTSSSEPGDSNNINEVEVILQ